MEDVQKAFDTLNEKIQSCSKSGATDERVAELKELATLLESELKKLND